jgi:ABC-2 type transport system ATP-binding protein
VAADPIVLTSVGKSYGPRRALTDVSFAIRAGSAVGYLGPNGAGKTTTFRLLTGLTRRDAGSIEVAGRDPGRGWAARKHLGVLSDGTGVLPYLTGDDLLERVAEAKGVPAGERRHATRRLAERVGVREALARPLGALSSGTLRRLLLAAALAGEPDVLLLDEPTAGLDPAARADLRALLRELRREGRTILLSTHLLEDVEAVCERVLFLRDGRLVGDEPVEGIPSAGGGRAPRAIRLSFARPLSPEERHRLGAIAEVAPGTDPRRAALRFEGDDRDQARLLAMIVGEGLPLLSAVPATSELERRYLERVGREDDG